MNTGFSYRALYVPPIVFGGEIIGEGLRVCSDPALPARDKQKAPFQRIR